jgi:hypothetical protein
MATHPVYAHDIALKLAKILGIERVRDIELSFRMEEAAQAKVTFLLNNIQAEAIVELLEPTKWGQGNG